MLQNRAQSISLNVDLFPAQQTVLFLPLGGWER